MDLKTILTKKILLMENLSKNGKTFDTWRVTNVQAWAEHKRWQHGQLLARKSNCKGSCQS